MQRSHGAARIGLLKPPPWWRRAFRCSAARGVSAKDLGGNQRDANREHGYEAAEDEKHNLPVIHWAVLRRRPRAQASGSSAPG